MCDASSVVSILEQPGNLEGIHTGGGSIVLKREIRRSGNARVWINGQSSSVQQLKAIGDLLVDLHGQHEHQSLLREENHLRFLDEFAATGDLRADVGIAFNQLRGLENRLANLELDEQRRAEKRQLYAFQLQELHEIDPRPEELEDLEKDLRLLENAQYLSDLAKGLNEASTGPEGVLPGLGRIQSSLEEMSTFSEEAATFLTELAGTRVTLQEIAEFSQSFAARVEADPSRLEKKRHRLGILNRTCQKYNLDYDELLDYLQTIQRELDQDQPVEIQRRELEREIGKARTRYSGLAAKLSETRSREAPLLTAGILQKLKRLGIPRVRFEIQIEQEDVSDGPAQINERRLAGDGSGVDRVSFWMQANPGEPLRPLVRIASGGEISRVMLALKASLSGKDSVGTLIFDEIDTGISGKIARVVGHELNALGTHHQIICITHLPQIASLADSHYRVLKVEQNQRTVTRVARLPEKERVAEIGMLLGDGQLTEATLAMATQLMGKKVHEV